MMSSKSLFQSFLVTTALHFMQKSFRVDSHGRWTFYERTELNLSRRCSDLAASFQVRVSFKAALAPGSYLLE